MKSIGNQSAWLLFVVFAVTPAICEELAFRGFILSGLARGGRLGIAVVISSLMFGIFHLIPQQAFNAALVGLVIGLIAIHSRSIFPAMLFHLLSNSMALLHSAKGSEVAANGVFFSKVGEGETVMLRYELPLLLLCGIGVGFIAYVAIKALSGRFREIPVAVAVIAALAGVKFAYFG